MSENEPKMPDGWFQLPCGCWQTPEGAVALVSRGAKIDTENLYKSPGKIIYVEGPAE